VIVFDGEALCAACDDGTHPALPDQCPHRQEEDEMRLGRRKATEEIIRAIQEADPQMPDSKLARQLGVTPRVVAYHRNESPGIHAIEAVDSPHERRPRTKPGIRVRLKKLSADFEPATQQTPADDWIPEPDPIPPAAAFAHVRTVHLAVDEKTFDAWWAQQSIDMKAVIFSGHFVIRVEGTVG
jgi:hypothetical protein